MSDPATDEGYQSEAMDRCYLVNSMLNEHLREHPFVEAHPDVESLIKQASEALSDAYQLMGNKLP